MATENAVFQVLVTKGNLSPLAAGNPIDNLAVGQIGIFNKNTNLSIDGTNLADAREIFLAVGADTDGDTVMDDIQRSAGQVIQTQNTKAYNVRCYSAALPKIVEITGFTAKCETDYGIKIEVVNQLKYITNGFNQASKSFVIRTGCCTQEDCTSCPEGDCNEIAVKLAANINEDPEGLFKAEVIDGPEGNVITDVDTWIAAEGGAVITTGTLTAGSGYTGAGTYTNVPLTGGGGSGAKATVVVAGGAVTSVTITDPGSGYAAGNSLSAANSNLGGAGTGFAILVGTIKAADDTCLGIRITSIPMKVRQYCMVNLGYFQPRSTNIIVSKVEGFNCNGEITETQNLKNEEGLGYDIAQLEYEAGGWNGQPGPYRLSTLAGMPTSGFVSNVDKAAKYMQIDLIYDQFSVGGWMEYLNNLETIIAIPCADTTTRGGLATMLDRIYAGRFDAKADDVALCDCTGADSTSDKTAATDGLN